MKIAPHQADRFLKSPPPEVYAFLFFGHEEGVIRDRSQQICKQLLGDGGDMNLVDLTADQVSEDPARLSDELNAFSMLGGDRVIRVTGVTDKTGKLILAALESVNGRPGARLILEAGDLKASSALRKTFENESFAAAVGCYADEGAGLESMVRQTLSENGYQIDREAMGYLLQHLSGNRLLNRQMLDKLITYAGAETTLTLGMVAACVPDQTEAGLQNMALLTAEGNFPELDRQLDRLYQEGISPVAVGVVVSRHFQKLLAWHAEMARGKSAHQIIESQRPAVFFKLKPRYIQQLNRWSIPALTEALDTLLRADRQLKTTGLPHESICRAALFRVAHIPRALAKAS